MSLQDTPIHQHFADGNTIITEGIMSNNAYVILKGKVRITKKIDKNHIRRDSQGGRSFQRDGPDLRNRAER